MKNEKMKENMSMKYKMIKQDIKGEGGKSTKNVKKSILKISMVLFLLVFVCGWFFDENNKTNDKNIYV